jgi:hypothetical protein
MDYSLLNFKPVPIKFVKPEIMELLFSFDPNLVKVTKEYDKEKDDFTRLHLKIFNLFSTFQKNPPGIKKIYWSNPTQPCKDCVIPNGLCIIKSPYTKPQLNTMYDELTYHVSNVLKTANLKGVSHANKSYTFAWEETISSLLVKLLQHQKDLAQNIIYSVNKLFGLLKINNDDKKYYADNTKLTLVKYKNMVGLHTHVDNINRAGSGPIITLSIGPDITIYDMIPLQKEYGKSIRVFINQGDFLVLNGDARWKWAHSLPHDYEYTRDNKPIPYRFAILFRLPSNTKTKKEYNKFWNEKLDTDSICNKR